jgi:hypothetical protein
MKRKLLVLTSIVLVTIYIGANLPSADDSPQRGSSFLWEIALNNSE